MATRKMTAKRRLSTQRRASTATSGDAHAARSARPSHRGRVASAAAVGTRTRAARRVAGGIAGVDRRLALLAETIRVLERTVTALEQMPQAVVDTLPEAQRQARARAIADGLRALHALRNDELGTLNDAIEARLPRLRRSTASLSAAFAKLDDRTAFIEASAYALAVIANLLVVAG